MSITFFLEKHNQTFKEDNPSYNPLESEDPIYNPRYFESAIYPEINFSNSNAADILENTGYFNNDWSGTIKEGHLQDFWTRLDILKKTCQDGDKISRCIQLQRLIRCAVALKDDIVWG
jgi:hypothetical protein